MPARRILATAALATAALTLSLTACDPTQPSDGKSAAAPAPTVTATAVPVSAPTGGTTAGAGQTTPKPTRATAKPGTSTKPSATAKPSADCTANAQHPGHKVINATVAWGSPDRIGANATKFVCGPDVPDDGYYEAVAPNTEYRFAAGAKATLLATGVKTTEVPLARLLQQINTCTGHPGDAGDYSCYGNMYDITVDATGRITTISELYHP
ncbi:hypothetical protein CFP65_2089 [Kitasatospora sp. MMS16-BH015]|uniref:hypothetical protein n=1 Tax=Kitasatospora sp. MMS16-BH015 TaxID=2018025 RepID=UPI000CA20C6C|nr:hypothetical protein [Kitasatospora sp. MMS16-BH015]AUG76947.1 hypothetical protein CFP65_2089 [Kitasatospora sp. MMS16-BH015]